MIGRWSVKRPDGIASRSVGMSYGAPGVRTASARCLSPPGRPRRGCPSGLWTSLRTGVKPVGSTRSHSSGGTPALILVGSLHSLHALWRNTPGPTNSAGSRTGNDQVSGRSARGSRRQKPAGLRDLASRSRLQNARRLFRELSQGGRGRGGRLRCSTCRSAEGCSTW